MTFAAPITPEQRDRITQLASEGMSRNAIARETGLSGGTVKKYANAAGYNFDRTKTKAATAAHQADDAARRATLHARILDATDRNLTDLAEGTKPIREIESASRAVDALSRALGNVNRSSPLPDNSQNAARDAMRAFADSLKFSAEQQRRLEAYEAAYGQIEVPDDNYGRPDYQGPDPEEQS